MVGLNRPVFVLFGSSAIVQSFRLGGWGQMLVDVYAGKADVVLRGYQGWNSKHAVELLDEIFPKDSAVQPSLVIAYFGANESIEPHPSGLGPHLPIPEYIENMRKIAAHLKSLSEKICIIFLSCLPLNEQKLHQFKSLNCPTLKDIIRTNGSSQQYSEACLQICEEMKVKAIDLWTTIQKRDDWADAYFSCDGVHLSPEGSKVVFEEIMEVLKDTKLDPPLHWELLQDDFAEEKPYDFDALKKWCLNAHSTKEHGSMA